MPYRSNIPCKHPGCAALIPYGQMYCEEHKPLHTKDRAHAAERGYGAKWQRERRKFLESNPFCVKCYEEGHITMATVVDHIKPHRGDQKLLQDAGIFAGSGKGKDTGEEVLELEKESGKSGKRTGS